MEKYQEISKITNFLDENKINYEVDDGFGIIKIKVKKRNWTLIYREWYDTWKVVITNSDTNEFIDTYNQYLDIILSDIKKEIES